MITCIIIIIPSRLCATREVKYYDNIMEISYPAIGANLLVMALEGFVFFALTVLLELNFFVNKFGILCMGKDTKPADICPDDVRKFVLYINYSLLTYFIRILMWLGKSLELTKEIPAMILYKLKILKRSGRTLAVHL